MVGCKVGKTVEVMLLRGGVEPNPGPPPNHRYPTLGKLARCSCWKSGMTTKWLSRQGRNKKKVCKNAPLPNSKLKE